jgi:hypothetical protein
MPSKLKPMEEGTFPCVKYANVYGVVIPGTEGRCGMSLPRR